MNLRPTPVHPCLPSLEPQRLAVWASSPTRCAAHASRRRAPSPTCSSLSPPGLARCSKESMRLPAIRHIRGVMNLWSLGLGTNRAQFYIRSSRLQNALKDAVRDNPELIEKSIEEGDAYFHVCGPEKNGYVRVIGLGPTPAELDMPGAKKCTSTRVQMEIEARRQSDKKVEAIQIQLDNMKQLLEKLLQQQQNASSTPNGSNNSPQVNLRSRPSLVEELENHDDDNVSQAEDEIHLSDDENMLMNRHTVVFPDEPHDEEARRMQTGFGSEGGRLRGRLNLEGENPRDSYAKDSGAYELRRTSDFYPGSGPLVRRVHRYKVIGFWSILVTFV